jgi:hypothetical protein
MDWSWAVVAVMALAWLSTVADQKRKRAAVRRAARKVAKQIARAADRQRLDPEMDRRPSAASTQQIDPGPGKSPMAQQPDPEPSKGPMAQSEKLKLCQALADRQATMIKSLRGKIERNASVMGEQGREIGRLMTLVHHQSSLIQSLQTADKVSSPNDPDDGRFRRLRALIVKELHPDHAPSDSVNGAIRAEIFKVLWPKIEQITGKA